MIEDKVAYELHRRYRPTKLSEMVGQTEAIRTLKQFSQRNEFPHALLFTGPPGVGKTSLARIVAKRLECSELDYYEVNAASFRGIDDVRRIQSEIGASPIGGKCRIWYLDECHGLTSEAQDCFLKTLEEPPSHVYFFLASTLHKKLKATVLSRCTQIPCTLISESDLEILVTRVAGFEDLELGPSIAAKIAASAQGSARVALVLLNSLIGISDPTAQLEMVEKTDVAPTAFEIAQAVFSTHTQWSKVAGLLSKVDTEAEAVRRVILGYAKSALLKGDNYRAHQVIEEFREPLFDAGSAFPLLVSSCYRLVKGK